MNTIVLMVMVGHASAGMQATTIPPSLASSKGLLAARMSMDGGSILRLRGGVGEPGGGVVQIDSKEAWDEILTKGLVVCDFYATWCGPCHKARLPSPTLTLTRQICSVLGISRDLATCMKASREPIDDEGEFSHIISCCFYPRLILFSSTTSCRGALSSRAHPLGIPRITNLPLTPSFARYRQSSRSIRTSSPRSTSARSTWTPMPRRRLHAGSHACPPFKCELHSAPAPTPRHHNHIAAGGRLTMSCQSKQFGLADAPGATFPRQDRGTRLIYSHTNIRITRGELSLMSRTNQPRFYNGAMTEQLMGADPVKLKEAIKNFIKRVRVLQGKEENAAAAAAL